MFHSVIPNLTVGSSIKGNIRLGTSNFITKAELQPWIGRICNRPFNTSRDVKAHAPSSMMQRRAENSHWHSRKNCSLTFILLFPTKSFHPAYNVCPRCDRTQWTRVLWFTRLVEERQTFFRDQMMRYVNSDFFTVKNWPPVSLSLKMSSLGRTWWGDRKIRLFRTAITPFRFI